MASNLIAMTFNLEAMASNLIAMASNLILIAMASNLPTDKNHKQPEQCSKIERLSSPVGKDHARLTGSGNMELPKAEDNLSGIDKLFQKRKQTSAGCK